MMVWALSRACFPVGGNHSERMEDVIERTQRWWTVTSRTAFLTGRALHVSDSPDTKAWGLMYRWHLAKQASAPVLMAGVGMALVAVVLLLPGTKIFAADVIKPVFAGLAALVLALGVLLTTKGSRKPFSVITLPVDEPTVLSDQLEELWPQIDAQARENLRRDLIRTYESRANWSPQTLQRTLLTRVERHRTLAQRLDQVEH